MLGVFLLAAFTRLGHKCQDLWSPCDEMHVCTDLTSVYTLIRKRFFFLGGGGGWGEVGVRTHVNSKGKIPSTGNNSPQRKFEPTTLHPAGQRVQHTTNQLFHQAGQPAQHTTNQLFQPPSSRTASPTHYQPAIPAPS